MLEICQEICNLVALTACSKRYKQGAPRLACFAQSHPAHDNPGASTTQGARGTDDSEVSVGLQCMVNNLVG